jgi:multiple sugar transport system permease protein
MAHTSTIAAAGPALAFPGRAPDRHFKWWIIAPAIFLLLFIGLFPLLYSLGVSFQHRTMLEDDKSFAGFQLRAAVQGCSPLAIAAAYRRHHGYRASRRTGPWHADGAAVPRTAAGAASFRFSARVAHGDFADRCRRHLALLFDNRYGPINQIIGWFAGKPVAALWTVKPDLVYPAILMAEIWQWTPFMFLILLAAVSNVDKSLTEAAEIDGAGYWRIFVKIVLPAIWPVMAIALLIRGLDLVRIFDIIWALTQGGPGTMTETISIYTYVQGFQQFELSYTAAVAFLVIFLLTVIVTWAIRRMGLAK